MVALNASHVAHATPTVPYAGSVGQVVATGGEAIPPDVLERLERLDDTVFAALAGEADALDQAADAWRDAQGVVQPRLLDETRRQYLCRARSVWRRYQRRPTERLATGFAALEILGLLER